ncbi:hypothetical protein PHYBLDRAFT_70166 [Phycomyces blakesleeanus NRRL 1555(-)]|uniref:Uncharacterized protein n=1 Tax=Phycomyces blakesleeanus (strain ATCC 8743b / DSM 1359 / FGSC 10004 / NBRC 33097 / NRRL 1555) TaxID=763407 RepID=A0A162TG13_PHYB8|nr:hypothetical protein PHYBLDRAFT_70166 [Phycomyces blakesleeanus NRRL 1555(-)]OAD66843.1 hypothetical protein PHYBLDRAFT_70166 [Phycomyces blakesleeanus NRRL 1555(-)]|eukprot:XP_018284883.1 hypothetical protein PHYBLDRAFT_70166 [Phycomyces blakesleeanus NRRL 1555(-)]
MCNLAHQGHSIFQPNNWKHIHSVPGSVVALDRYKPFFFVVYMFKELSYFVSRNFVFDFMVLSYCKNIKEVIRISSKRGQTKRGFQTRSKAEHFGGGQPLWIITSVPVYPQNYT